MKYERKKLKRLTCPKCSAQFQQANAQQKYCSLKCRQWQSNTNYRAKQKAAKVRKVVTPEDYRRRALKRTASMLGLTVEEYSAHYDAGERWCSGCRAWHPSTELVTRSYCRKAKREKERRREARLRDEAAAEKVRRAKLAKLRFKYGEPAVTQPGVAVPSWMSSSIF